MTNRRTFLTQAGLLTAGVMMKPNLLTAAPKAVRGIQLYSLRDELPKDVKGVIAKVAQAGYQSVETYGYSKKAGHWGLSLPDFAQLLKDNNLKSSSGHYGVNKYFADGSLGELDDYTEAALALGQEAVIIPGIGGQFIKSADECKRTAEKMNKAGEILKKSKLTLGYHNHNFEWKDLGGTSFYDILLQELDPKLVILELDLYWAVRADKDPIALFDKYKGHFGFVHVKDRDKTNGNLNTEVGKGSIDYKAIIPKAKAAGVKHFIVEQENWVNNIDPYVSIKESADYMKNTLKI